MTDNRILMLARFLIGVSLIMGISTTASGQDNGGQRATLRGLGAIAVYVTPLGQRVEEAGLSTDTIRTDSELELRRAGIAVVDPSKSPSQYLAVNITCASDPQRIAPILACNIAVHLYQAVALLRNPSVTALASTWGEDSAAMVGLGRISILRSGASDMVEEFANDYLAANQKQ